LGYLPEQEALQALASGNNHPDLESIRDTWQNAVQKINSRDPFEGDCHVKEIFHPESGREIEAGLERVKVRLAEDPILRNNPWDFKEVEIDGLISIQKQVNVDVADEIVGSLKGPEDFAGAIKHALLTELPSPNIMLGRDENGFLVTSRNLNLGVTGFGLGGQENPTTKESIQAASIQFGCLLSYVRVVHFQGRYYLRDGYHRVFGLRQKGFTYTPCILMQGGSASDIGISPGLFSLEIVLSPNPPLVRDFSENATEVQAPRLTKVLRVKIEPLTIPA
jgi:hypothetical protein